MHTQPVNPVPVEHVGGGGNGTWPSGIEELAVDDRLTVPRELADGSEQEVEVTITSLEQIIRPDGTETDGYVVAEQFNDPTL